MRLMRNTMYDGQCKYALVRMDKLAGMKDDGIYPTPSAVRHALRTLADAGLLENPRPGDPEEFFAVKLKDPNSPGAIAGYATEAMARDPELAHDVSELLNRAGERSVWCKPGGPD